MSFSNKTDLIRFKTFFWNQIDWFQIEKKIWFLQELIFLSSKCKKKRLLLSLQELIILIPEAKLLSVKLLLKKEDQFSLKFKYTNSSFKINLAKSLRFNFENHFLLENFNNKISYLKIFSFINLAKQILVKFALEPEWEAIFDCDYYIFRSGRSFQDAVEAIKKTSYKWILNINLINSFYSFDPFSIESKLDCPKKISYQVNFWLKKNLLKKLFFLSERYKTFLLHPHIFFRNSGLVLFLIGVALFGLKSFLRTDLTFKDCKIINCCEDLIILGKNKNVLFLLKFKIQNWLNKVLGLDINLGQIFIKHSSKSFNFIGFSFFGFNINYKIKSFLFVEVFPSQKSQRFIVEQFRLILRSEVSSSLDKVTFSLVPILFRYINFYRYCNFLKTFCYLDSIFFGLIQSWLNRRFSFSKKFKLWSLHFPGSKTIYNGKIYSNRWILKSYKVFTSGVKCEIFIPKLSWTTKKSWKKIRKNSSPFDRHFIYWKNRYCNYGLLLINWF